LNYSFISIFHEYVFYYTRLADIKTWALMVC